MPNCIIFVGLPGTGKSTFYQSSGLHSTHKLVSSDLRIEKYAAENGITYDQAFSNPDVLEDARKWCSDAIWHFVRTETDFVIDRTNLTAVSRAAYIEQIPKDWKKFAIVFRVKSGFEHRRRLDSRPGKTIPEDVINTMMRAFETPTTDEGFDEVLEIVT